jgi:hypothetical protein
MAGKARKLSFTLYLGDKQIDKLTDEQWAKMAENLRQTMTTYYLGHPEEAEKIKWEEHNNVQRDL